MKSLCHASRNRKFSAAFAVAAGLLCGVYASAFTGGASSQPPFSQDFLIVEIQEMQQCCAAHAAPAAHSNANTSLSAASVSGAPLAPSAPQTPRPVDRSTTPEQIVGDIAAWGNLPAIVVGLLVLLVVLVGCLGVLLRRRDG